MFHQLLVLIIMFNYYVLLCLIIMFLLIISFNYYVLISFNYYVSYLFDGCSHEWTKFRIAFLQKEIIFF